MWIPCEAGVIHEFIEEWLREKFTAERREAARGIFVYLFLALCTGAFAMFVVMGLMVMFAVPIMALRIPAPLPLMVAAVAMLLMFVIYPFIRPRPQATLVALGDEDDAPVVSLVTEGVGFSTFRTAFNDGAHFTYRRLAVAILFAPPMLAWFALEERRRGRRARQVDISGCAAIIEVLLAREGRVPLEQLMLLVGRGDLRRTLPDVVTLKEVHLLTAVRPPGIALTPAGRAEIADYIEKHDGVVPDLIAEVKEAVVAKVVKPVEMVDVPPEIADGSRELPPQPLPPGAEGVMAAPVGREPEHVEATGSYNPFALLVDGDAGRLEPTVQPEMTPSAPDDAKPLELA
ncbi:MAG: hypothetical protein IT462_04490 [Planctomycetes bacterium]|nr:hypothetical protein [Planctomycetota bacterium]